MLRTLLILAVSSLFGTQLAPGQGGTVSGIVVKLGSEEPLPGTHVALLVPEGSRVIQETTAAVDGTYLFRDVAAGQYRLVATRTDGFLPTEYGQSNPNVRGLPISLAGNETLTGRRIEMPPPASITGHVYDVDGDPVPYAKVQALRVFYRDGARALNIVQSVQTNDAGEYRLFWLAPGTYYIAAQREDSRSNTSQLYIRPPGDQTIHEETSAPVIGHRVLESGEVVTEVYVPVYLPGTMEAREATAISVHAGDTATNSNIRLPEMPLARTVRGTVMDGLTGQPAKGGTVRAMPSAEFDPNVRYARSAISPSGTFELSGLIAGPYIIYASMEEGPVFGGRVAQTAIEVNSKDLDKISLIVTPSFDLHGRFVIDGESSLQMERLHLTLIRYPSGTGNPGAQEPRQGANSVNPNDPKPDGSFTMAGVGTGDYKVGVSYVDPGNVPNSGSGYNLPPTLYIKSIKLGSQEIFGKILHLDKEPEGPFEIILGTSLTTVSGNVQNDSGDPATNSLVVLIPDDRRRVDLFRVTASDANGRFRLRAAPGHYKLFAFDRVESGMWFDPSFIQTYDPLGTTIEAGGEAVSAMPLKVVKVREP